MKLRTKKQSKAALALIVAGAFLVSGCATTAYTPSHSAQIKSVYKGYQRDGQMFKGSKGLVQAVESNAEASQYAQESRKHLLLGNGLSWGGVAAVTAGSFVLDSNQSNSSPRNITALSLASTGLVAVIVGAVSLLKGQRRAFDAVNKYNDDFLQMHAPNLFVSTE